jgi:hypothetical protein
MVIVCAWCQKYMGCKEPFDEASVSHGICPECSDREALEDAPVLVVSRERAETIPMLHSLLRGAPEIAIVVDRRGAERRRGNGKGNGNGRVHDPAEWPDRRSTERRRTPTFYLV